MTPSAPAQPRGASWLAFALLTVVSWGVYGLFLFNGQMGMLPGRIGLMTKMGVAKPIVMKQMGLEMTDARFKAFLFVGIAYFLVAVLAPALLLLVTGANWKYPAKGMAWSLVAGIVGAIGAFGVLLALGAGGAVAVVMAIVFAGAPIVNAFVSLLLHPPAGGWRGIRWQFWFGILVAALGGCLVTYLKPGHGPTTQGLAWLSFALLTVATWGVYGVFLHTGQIAMQDPVSGRYKSFLFVGIAYFLVAVIAPLLLLVLRGATWHYSVGGMGWSLAAGIAGAVGAFGVLLAFGAKGLPSVVMAIVFAGAPVVNAVAALLQEPPKGGWSALPGGFVLGIAFAALGGCVVTFFKPAAGGPAKKAPAPVTTVEKPALEPAAH